MVININNKKDGFTIVELLVVIVVIGILAAITIISYTGITSRANTTTNQSNANSIVSAASALYAENSAYPAWTTNSATTIGLLNVGVSKVPTTIVLQNSAPSAGSNIGYVVTAGPGVCISYWDYSVPGVRYYGNGNVTVAADRSTCS